MADKNSAEENTFIKAYEELEKSKTPIRGPEAFPLVEIVHGPRLGAWFTVAYQKEITLGRAATNSIILEDNSVSRSHAVLQSAGEGFSVRDIGSRNGTFLNGKKISGEVPLNHLDVIKIGIYTLRYLEEPTEETFELTEEHTPRVEDIVEPSLTGTEEFPSEEAPATPLAQDEAPEENTINEDLDDIIAKGAEVSPDLPPEAPPLPEEIPEAPLEVAEPEMPPPVPAEEKPGSRSLKSLFILLLILGVFGGGGFLAYRLGAFDKLKAYFASSEGTKVAKKSPKEGPKEGQKDPKAAKPDQEPAQPVGKTVPVVLEVSAEPIGGKIFYKGKELGSTPFKISIQVPLGQPQELSGEFFVESLGQKLTQKQPFQAEKQDDLVTVQFQPSLGSLNIKALPKNGDLFIQGQFEGAPAKAIKLENISFGTPVHLPYGKYVAEIRVPEPAAGSGPPVSTVRYRREFEIGEGSKEYTIEAADEAVTTFPAEIITTPAGAELFVDGKSMGKTPFKGTLSLGSHKLVLKHEGFNDYEKEIKVDVNAPYVANLNLDTTPAGSFVNKGRQLIKKGKHNDAIEQLAEALKRNPDPAETSQIHLLLGDTFIRTKTYDQALAYYQKAAGNPDYAAMGRLGSAEAKAALGQKDKAFVDVIDVYINTEDPKIRSRAETVFHKMSPTKSVLYVATEPKGAQITINGNPIGQPTPVILSDISLGSYRINISKSGFKPYETRVTVPISAIKPVVVKLQAE